MKIYTPLTASLVPLYPVTCPVCDAAIGALYRHGLSLRPHVQECTKRCDQLWRFGYGRAHWRALPADLRQIQLAAGMLDYESRQIGTS